MNYIISHSAKGSTWKKHKYVKKENGRYVYPKSSSKAETGGVAEDNVTKKKKEKEKVQAPMTVMGYSHVNIGGGSHAFSDGLGDEMTEKTMKIGLDAYEKAIAQMKENKKKKAIAKKEKLDKLYKSGEPDTIMGAKTYKGKQKDKLMNRTGIHNF